MRKRFLILFLLVSAVVYGQTPAGYIKANMRFKWTAGIFDSALHVPQYSGTPSGTRNGAWVGDGAVAIDTVNNLFYFRSGGSWHSTSSGAGWLLTGNSGTTSSNFIGTTDNQPLSFRVNNRWAGRLTTSGNIFWGDSAGVNNIGYSNVAIGRGALRNDVGGINLVAIGDSALYNNLGDVGEEEGLQNTAVGSKALYSNTTGSYNTANGYYSLYSNTTGYSNTANGLQSLFSNTTGSGNTANGYQSLYSNTTGGGNTANGYRSLYSNTTGDNNVGIGYQSGYHTNQKTDAKNQILIGANTYGTRDSIAVIGASFMKETILRGKLIDSTLSAGAGTKAVRWNDATGEFTYTDTTAGGGGSSGWSLTGNAGTNPSTNFIGTTDAQPLMFRVNNANAGSIGKANGAVYLGQGAGENDNAEDDPNVGVGYYALNGNTTGSSNSAVGNMALNFNTTGRANSAVGAEALYSNTTGNSNSAVGASAGNNAKQKPDAKYQTLLGSSTYGTRDSISVIGANFIKETIVRGKLIDSTLSAGSGTKAVRWNSSTGEFTYADTTVGGGGLTIGTTTIANSATGSILYDSSGILSRNADLYWDVSNKRLGIATRTPSAPIHVYKWGSSSPLIALTGMYGTLNIYADASTQFHWSEKLVVDKDLALGGDLSTAYGKTYDWNAGSFINIQSIDFNGAGSRIKLAPDYNGGSTVANQGVIVKYTNPSSGNYPQAAFQAYSSSDDTDKSFLISSRGFGYLKNSKTDETVFYLKAAASQTANLLELKNSSSTILSSFDKDGKLYLGSSSAPTTTLQVNGTMAVNQGTDVASANNLAVVANSTEITGTTQVNLIANTGWVNGAEINLLLANGITIKNGQTTSGSNITILLDGAADFVTASASMLTLVLSEVGGTQAWREKSRRSY